MVDHTRVPMQSYMMGPGSRAASNDPGMITINMGIASQAKMRHSMSGHTRGMMSNDETTPQKLTTSTPTRRISQREHAPTKSKAWVPGLESFGVAIAESLANVATEVVNPRVSFTLIETHGIGLDGTRLQQKLWVRLLAGPVLETLQHGHRDCSAAASRRDLPALDLKVAIGDATASTTPGRYAIRLRKLGTERPC